MAWVKLSAQSSSEALWGQADMMGDPDTEGDICIVGFMGECILVGPNRPTYQGDTQQKPKLLFFFFVI
jgi:hypothetical protein